MEAPNFSLADPTPTWRRARKPHSILNVWDYVVSRKLPGSFAHDIHAIKIEADTATVQVEGLF
jgi:hypothetical protein